MKRDVMLDLEALGTGPRAAIVAIGACEFDPRGGEVPSANAFYSRVTLASAMQYGEVDASTLLWWMQQADQARKDTFLGDACRLELALISFNQWVSHIDNGGLANNVCVWGNGATFDNVVIRSAMTAVGETPGWSFRNDKCYRTVINLLPKDKQPEFVRSGTAHNALDDAVTQALYLQKVYKALGL